MKQLKFCIFLVIFLLFSAVWAVAAPVHPLDCKDCHLKNKTINELGGGNICLACHGSPPSGGTAGFVTGDASASFGNNPSPNYETSHNWAAISKNPAAGAVEPSRDSYPGFYSNYGTTSGRVACSRCHQPHGDSDINPKLLTTTAAGYASFSAPPLTPDDMCLACHAPWNQSGNHGWLTHPLVTDYSASVTAAPEKYKAILSNKDNATIQLVNGGVSCTSCHGIHFVDSDSSTVDGPTGTLSKSDGKLLRGDGANSSDKSSLCQTCHIYTEHGKKSGEMVGCLVCHSGHSYDPSLPNYYVLRKSASTIKYGTVHGLDYSDNGVLVDNQKASFWNDGLSGSAGGYCERCHGDAEDIGLGAGTYHVAGAICTNCHQHSNEVGGFAANCGGCHGNTATQQAWPDNNISNNIIPDYPWVDDDVGSHAVHITAIGKSNASCDYCHPGNPPTNHHFDDETGVQQAEVARMDNNDDGIADYWRFAGGATSGSGGSVYIKSKDGTNDVDAYYRMSDSTCVNINCHGNSQPLQWGTSGCLNCHSVRQGDRVAVKSQFEGNSHHIQKDGSLTDAQCYQCHWEANSDGTINPDYHGGTYNSGSEVDLVIYGAGERPVTYTEGSTAVRYTADGLHSEIIKINDHCLGCHSDQNSLTEPFGDDKTPQEYAWDGTSIDSRYSQSQTTSFGKYTGTANAAPKDQTKAYSAHGNASLNEGGWAYGAAPAGTGVDGLLPNTRAGTENIACFDCHNSHGSSAGADALEKTTSYNSATLFGGILKDTEAGRGGYSVTYKPVAGGTVEDKNLRNPGASLCMDCHLTADSGTSLPWGYKETFGAEEKIIGYYDSPYFSPGPTGAKVRSPFMAGNETKGGHFGASTPLLNSATFGINGLCTPCHDPHGVSPTLGSDQEYGVPLLKGTWLTSPYKEDLPPISNSTRRVRGSTNDRYIYIDGTTFGSHIKQLVVGIQETPDQFAGLCLNCHPQEILTVDGSTTPNEWKTKDRVHEAVKGWDTSGTPKHYFSCSKCHSPHIGSTLPRLMVTNCMDSRHKGRAVKEPSPLIEDLGTWWDDELMYGKCGEGRIPGSHTDCRGTWNPVSDIFTCHEAQNGFANQGTDQSWNEVTPWSPLFYVSRLPYITNPLKSVAFPGKVRFYVRWETNLSSDSAVDFGFTPDYGRLAIGTPYVTNHIIPLDNLENHSTYYFQVRSTTSGGDTLAFGYEADQSYHISVPPDPVTINLQPSQLCSGGSVDVTLSWNETQDVDGGPIEYYAEVDDVTSFTSPNVSSGWITANSATLGPLACNDTWYWHVKARDADHEEAETNWSSRGSFDVGPDPSKPATPVLVSEPDFTCGSNCSVALVSNIVPNSYPLLYGAVQYYFEVDDDPAFNSLDKVVGWSTSRVASITGLDGDKTWHFRVKARYANYTEPELESDWSISRSFKIIYPTPSTPTALFTQDVVSPASATLIWSAATAYNNGPVEYDIQVDDDPNFLSVDFSDSGISATTAPAGLLGVGTWYWQVKARDVDHPTAETPWSNTGEFRVYATAPTSKTITFTWPDVPFGSITIDGVPYGGPAGSVDIEIKKDIFTAEIVGAPGQSGGGEPDPAWDYEATQAAGGNPGNIAAIFTPNDGNIFTVKVGATPPYVSAGGAGGGASYVAKDNTTIMYAAASGGGGGGDATYWDGEVFDGEVYTWKERGAAGSSGEGFGSATGGAGGAGSTSTSGAGVAGSPGGSGGFGFSDYLGISQTTLSGDTTYPRVSITTIYPGPAAPILDWVGVSNYSTDGVDPESGAQLSDFTFRVKYEDSDNDAPWPIEVWIDLDDNGNYETDEKFAMAEEDTDTDFTDGKLYTYTAALAYAGDGTLNYRFYASDGENDATGDPTLDQTITIFNTPPNIPVIVSPTDGEIDVPQPVTLVATDFADPDANDTLQSSQWLLSSGSGADFITNLLYDSGTFDPVTLHRPEVSVVQGSTYYWMVRYQDNHGAWSPYSPEASFTLIDNAPPDMPTNLTPVDGDEDMSTEVTLVASAFNDTDGDSHQGSIWQISTQGGANFVDGRIYNSGAVAATTSHDVSLILSPDTNYFWRVSYQDKQMQWSPFSSDTRFKTTNFISYWPLDEGGGISAIDTSGNNDGTLKDGASWNTLSPFSGTSAIDFDGSVGDPNNPVDVNNHGMTWTYTNGVPTNNFTIEAMVKTSETHQINPESNTGTTGISGQKYLFGAQHRGTNGGAGVSVGTNGISVYEHGAGYMPPLAVYTNSIGTDWNHIIVTYTNKQPRIYLNGDLVHTGLTSTKPNVYAPVQLGGGSYGFFTGSVDEVAIYSQPLSKAGVLKRCIEVGKCTDADLDSDGVTDSSDNCPFDYNPGQEDSDSDDIGNVCEYISYWKMDDGSGNIASDETGNNDISVNGGTTWSTGADGNGALLFDGSVNVDVSADNVLDNYAGDFSISLWLKFPLGAVNPKWSFGKGTDPYRSLGIGIGHWFDTDVPVAPTFFVNDGTHNDLYSDDSTNEWPHRLALSAGTIPRDTWGHFVWTIDRTNHVMKAYRNGQYVTQRDIFILGTNVLTDDKLFQLGSAGDASSKYTGSIDNLAVYDFVLEPNDVHALCEEVNGAGNCP